MRGIQALFVRRDEVKKPEVGGLHYRSMGDGQRRAEAVSGGHWGPVASVAMITRDGRSWNELHKFATTLGGIYR